MLKLSTWHADYCALADFSSFVLAHNGVRMCTLSAVTIAGCIRDGPGAACAWQGHGVHGVCRGEKCRRWSMLHMFGKSCRSSIDIVQRCFNILSTEVPRLAMSLLAKFAVMNLPPRPGLLHADVD
jgi:hypothetical protein